MSINDATIIPATLRSWIPVTPDHHFPIQNLPFGMGGVSGGSPEPLSRLGDTAIRLNMLAEAGLVPSLESDSLAVPRHQLVAIRSTLVDLFSEGNPALKENKALSDAALVPIDQVEMVAPCRVPQFVDFYAGIHHASNVGRMFRPDQPPLLPNYRHVPIGYNGRASTLIFGDGEIRRPNGQTKAPTAELPTFGPTQELDLELEMGFLLGAGNEGQPRTPEEVDDLILGFTLVNDWSARDSSDGNTSPSGRSSRRASQPRFRRGSCCRKPWNLFESRVLSKTRCPFPISGEGRGSTLTSSYRCSSKPEIWPSRW